MATSTITSGILDRNNTDHRYPMVIAEYAQRALWANNVCKKFCRQESIENNGATTWQTNIQSTNSAAAALTEGQDTTNTQLDHTLVTVVTAEVGCMTTITKWMQKNAVGRMRDVQYWAEQLGKSMAAKIDTDLTALFSALNTGTAAGSGSGDTDIVTDIENAQYLLEANNALSGVARPVAVLHPRTTSYLRQQVYNTANTIYSDFQSKKGVYADANGWFGEFMGVDIWQTTHVAELSKAKRGAMFVPGHTFGFIEKYGLTPFTDADPSLRAVEVGIHHAYGVGELEDLSGVCISSDA